MTGEAHIANAFRLLLIQTIGGLAVGGVVIGVLIATTHLGLSGALFVAAIVVALAGIAWSLGGPAWRLRPQLQLCSERATSTSASNAHRTTPSRARLSSRLVSLQSDAVTLTETI